MSSPSSCFFVLIQASLFVLANDYQTVQRVHEVNRARHQDHRQDLSDLDDLLWKGVYDDRSPQPLRMFVRGLDDEVPLQVHTSMGLSRRVHDAFYRNPVFALFATPDLNYIVNIVVSLLAMLFVFDAVCGEKERATLKLMLANSVPRDVVLLGKWLGGYLTLAVPFTAALLGGIVYVYLTGALALRPEVVERIVWISGVSLLYISVFFSLGLMISTLTHRTSTALLAALFAWVGLVLVLPNLSPVLSRVLAPVPSLQKTKAEKAAIDKETEFRLDRYFLTVYVLGPERWRRQEKIRAEGERRKQKLDQFYEDKLQAQIDLSTTLSRISPSASFTFATTQLAGTGIDLFSRFRQGYKRFEDGFREYGRQFRIREYTKSLPDDWYEPDHVPSLRIAPQHVDSAVAAVFTDILLLCIFNALFFMLSYLFFLRYDVT